MAEKNKFYLTKKGLETLRKEYEKLRQLKGLKSKNGAPSSLHSEELDTEFVSFREDMDLLESRIDELEYILKNFELIKPPPQKERERVHLGASVAVQVDGQKDEFTIIGTLEANPSLGKISNESPVGKVLLNHKVGDEVCLNSPIKTVYKIKKIRYQPL